MNPTAERHRGTQIHAADAATAPPWASFADELDAVAAGARGRWRSILGLDGREPTWIVLESRGGHWGTDADARGATTGSAHERLEAAAWLARLDALLGRIAEILLPAAHAEAVGLELHLRPGVLARAHRTPRSLPAPLPDSGPSSPFATLGSVATTFDGGFVLPAPAQHEQIAAWTTLRAACAAVQASRPTAAPDPPVLSLVWSCAVAGRLPLLSRHGGQTLDQATAEVALHDSDLAGLVGFRQATAAAAARLAARLACMNAWLGWTGEAPPPLTASHLRCLGEADALALETRRAAELVLGAGRPLA